MTETTRTNIQKRSNDTLSETPLPRKKANKGGPKFDEVWQYYIQGDDINPGHYKATCYHFKKEWSRGRPVALKAHLANESHAINLIAADLVKINDIKEFISNCGMITRFFNNSHQASSILAQGLKNMKINIERLQTWCKTRWDEEFFVNCHHIRSIWAPIKECINILKSKSATLADCFMQMIKLAIAIFRLPSSNPYKVSAIQIFNRRYLEFQHPAYLLCYFLHPYYRGLSLNGEGFRNAAITATTLWQNLGYSEQECKELLTQFQKYDQKLKPYDLSYEKNMDMPELWWDSIRSKPYHLRNLALRLFGIAVLQTGCERNFSTLKWIIGDRRTRLDVQKLEGISKIRSYYLTSIKNELSYYGKHLDEAELREVANISAVGEIVALDDNNDNTNYLLLEEDQDIIDLTQPIFENLENIDNNTSEETNIDRNMDFNPIDLVNQVLEN
ncbi:15373_t:CDS:2 [Rhizophagus irregularis]|nr:15373_t:CDS:2 [Rhizophagus irregularis]